MSGAAAGVPTSGAGASGTPTSGAGATGSPAGVPTSPAPAADADAPIPPVSAYHRPARPAWRPMEAQPLPSGITVFGTRLTYRQAAIGAGIVLLVLVLVITLVASTFGDDDENQPNTAPTAAGGAKPSAAATTPSAAQSSPASPSAPPTTTTAPAGVTLPADWKWYSPGATSGAPDFLLPIPKNARIDGGGNEIQFRWNNRLLIFGRTKSPQADAYDDWKRQEAARRGTYDDYDYIRLDRVTYRDFESAADWEFTYTSANGNPQHVLRRNVKVDGSAAYSLNWYVSTGDWDAAQRDLKLLLDGFQPK